jgi:hypothetical protein
MTLSERVNKLLDARSDKKEAQKFAWQRASDGHFYRQLEVEEGETSALIHVLKDKVYQSDKHLINVEEIHGKEAEDYIASATATMALRSSYPDKSTGLAGFGESIFSAAEGMANAVAEGEMNSNKRKPQPDNPANQPQPTDPASHPLYGMVNMGPRGGQRRPPQTYEEWMGR